MRGHTRSRSGAIFTPRDHIARSGRAMAAGCTPRVNLSRKTGHAVATRESGANPRPFPAARFSSVNLAFLPAPRRLTPPSTSRLESASCRACHHTIPMQCSGSRAMPPSSRSPVPIGAWPSASIPTCIRTRRRPCTCGRSTRRGGSCRRARGERSTTWDIPPPGRRAAVTGPHRAGRSGPRSQRPPGPGRPGAPPMRRPEPRHGRFVSRERSSCPPPADRRRSRAGRAPFGTLAGRP